MHAIDYTIARKKECPEWRGEDSAGGGRPRELAEDERKQLVKLVFKERGKAKVTIFDRKKL